MSETMGRMVECTVSQDGLQARVALAGGHVLLDVAEVEALAWDLAACRAVMAPRRTTTMFAGSRIAIGAGLHTQREADGRVLVAVMHPGLGWVGSRLEAAALAGVMPASRSLLRRAARSSSVGVLRRPVSTS